MRVAYKPKNMSPTRPPNWKEVRSERLARANAQRQEPQSREQRRGLVAWDRVPVVVVGWAILAVWWAAGGRYTIDGTPLLINEIFHFFRITARLGAITDPIWYAYLCWVPVAFSVIERRNRPRRGLAWNASTVYTILIWAIVAGADFGSTWLAITHPDPDAWPLAIQVAAIPVLALLWTGATTFAPETGFAALWRYLRS